MYKIYYADMGKATGVKEMKKRPVVVVDKKGGKVKVYKLTSRYKDDKYHVRMNNYIIHGYCDMSRYNIIDKKYLLDYMRDCTISETEAISKKIF